jgi:hypothetical protein
MSQQHERLSHGQVHGCSRACFWAKCLAGRIGEKKKKKSGAREHTVNIPAGVMVKERLFTLNSNYSSFVDLDFFSWPMF